MGCFDSLSAEVIDESKPAEFVSATKSIELPIAWSGNAGHYGCLDEMFTALEEGRFAETDCIDNIKSMKMVFGAIESARSMKKVYL